MVDQRMTEEELERLVRDALKAFYDRRIQALDKLELKKVLTRKNPYLFRAVGIVTPSEMVAALLQAHVSSSDETIFGDAFFERIARDVSRGKDSQGEGLDIDIDVETEHTVIAVKSGPFWANSRQKTGLKQDFEKARRIFSTRRSEKRQFKALLGQCYGRTKGQPDAKRAYYVLSGQAFWRYITGDADFYLRLMRLLGDVTAQERERYQIAFDSAVQRFTEQFDKDFSVNGAIDWEKLMKFNSGERVRQSSKYWATGTPQSSVTSSSSSTLTLDEIFTA